MILRDIKTRDDFGELFQEHYLKGTGAEIGVQNGIFSEQILTAWKGNLLCVDVWNIDDEYNEARKRLCNRARLLKGRSVEISRTIQDESLDFVYIDADHHYKSVKEDLEAWYRKVRKGGIISGHDYCRYLEFFGVIEAVDEFCKTHRRQFKITTNDFWEGHSFPSWYFLK